MHLYLFYQGFSSFRLIYQEKMRKFARNFRESDKARVKSCGLTPI